jgi:hypothetical protein
LSSPWSDPHHDAENAFWDAVEEGRNQIRAAGLRFDERSHHRFREAHEEGNLLDGLCAGVERYYKEGSRDPNRLLAVAQVIKHDLPSWEHVLDPRGLPVGARRDARARLSAERAIADAKDLIRFL